MSQTHPAGPLGHLDDWEESLQARYPAGTVPTALAGSKVELEPGIGELEAQPQAGRAEQGTEALVGVCLAQSEIERAAKPLAEVARCDGRGGHVVTLVPAHEIRLTQTWSGA